MPMVLGRRPKLVAMVVAVLVLVQVRGLGQVLLVQMTPAPLVLVELRASSWPRESWPAVRRRGAFRVRRGRGLARRCA